MGHDDGYGLKNKVREHGDEYYLEKKMERSNKARSISTAKEAHKSDGKEHQQRESEDLQNPKSRSEGRSADRQVRVSDHESSRHRRRDKTNNHEDDMLDSFEEMPGEKSVDRSKGVRDSDYHLREDSHHRDKHKDRGKGGKEEDYMLESLDIDNGADMEMDVDESKLGRRKYRSKHVDRVAESRCGNESNRDGVHDREKPRQKHKDVQKHEEISIDSLEDVHNGKHVDRTKEGRYANSERHLDEIRESQLDDGHVRESSYERDRNRHKDKSGKYSEESSDKIDDSKIRKLPKASKEESRGKSREKSAGKDEERVFDPDVEKADRNEADRQHHHDGHRDTLKESEWHDMQEKREWKLKGRKQKDYDDTDSGDTRQESGRLDVPDKHEWKEKGQKRKDYDDAEPGFDESGDRHSKRKKDFVYPEKFIFDGKEKGEKRKRDTYDSEHNSHANTSSEANSVAKFQIIDRGKQVHKMKDANGLSSVANEPWDTAMGSQQVSLAIETTSHVVQTRPPGPPKGTAVEASTQGHAGDSSKSGPGVSSGVVKASSLSLDALMKAKKALQMQKELSEKLKKLPQLSKAEMAAPASLTPSASLPLVASGSASTSVLSGTELQTSTKAASALATGIGGSIGFVSGVMPGMPGVLPNLGTISNYEAVKRAQEYVVRLGFQQPPGSMPLLGVVPLHGSFEAGMPPQPKTVKVPVLRLDAHGREIDEHGNVLDRPKVANVSTLKETSMLQILALKARKSRLI